MQFVILAVVSAVAAALLYRAWGRAISVTFAAAGLTTLLWFALSLPFALADGGWVWGRDLPYALRAAVICLAVTLPIAGLVSAASAAARKEASAPS